MSMRTVAVASAAVLALSGCGSAPGPAAGAAATSAAGARAAHRTGLIMPMPSALGQVVTDDFMFTLYWYDRDGTAPPRSACSGDCAVRWPPVLVDGVVQYDGGDQSLVGTVPRADGTTQLTLRGRPLYRFSGDRAEGETKGHGIDGAWFAAAPDGGKAGGATPTPGTAVGNRD